MKNRYLNPNDAAFATADSLGHHQEGLTKLEYIATKAMAAIIITKSDWALNISSQDRARMLANEATAYAEALINELNKSEKIKPSELTSEEIAELKLNDEDL